MQSRVTDPELTFVESVMLDALNLQGVPPFSVRATAPVNPLSAETVIVEVPRELAFTTTTVGLADIVKSGGGGAAVT